MSLGASPAGNGLACCELCLHDAGSRAEASQERCLQAVHLGIPQGGAAEVSGLAAGDEAASRVVRGGDLFLSAIALAASVIFWLR